MAVNSYWQQFQRQRISRRRLLVASGAGAAGIAVVTACGRGTKSGQTATPIGAGGTPKTGGVYKSSITGDWGTIDPLTSVAYGPGILAKMYNGLAIRSSRQSDKFYYDLAAKYEQPDPATYIFTIRPGVKIAPNTLGIPERNMDATDCKAWLDATVANKAAVAHRWTDVWLDSSSANADGTFTIKTKGPYAYFFTTVNVPVGGMIPPKEFFEQKLDMASQGVGAGPYVLRPGTFVNTGGAILDRNKNYNRTDPNHNNAQLPYIDSLQVFRITDRQPRSTAFIGKQIYEYDPQSRAEVDSLKAQISGLEVFEVPAFTFISFTMNPTKPPWDNDKVRMAANYALNRPEYVNLIFHGDAQPNGLVHWSLGDYALPPSELAKLQPFDPNKSKQLLQEAGHTLPLKIKVMYPSNSDIEFHNQHLPIWRQQMQAAGFALDEEPLDFTTWLVRYQNIQYDSSFSLNQIYETPEVNLDFHGSKGPTNNNNYAIGIGKLYPEIDTAIKNSKSTTVITDQVKRVLDTQRLIYSKGPAFLPIVTWTTFTVRYPFAKNWPTGLGTAYELYQNDEWLDPTPS